MMCCTSSLDVACVSGKFADFIRGILLPCTYAESSNENDSFKNEQLSKYKSWCDFSLAINIERRQCHNFYFLRKIMPHSPIPGICINFYEELLLIWKHNLQSCPSEFIIVLDLSQDLQALRVCSWLIVELYVM